MKCDEPKVYKVYTTRNEGAFGFCEGADPTDIELEHESVCLKSDVDKAIAEKDGEIRRLKRALYKACANWGLSTLAWLDCIDQGDPGKWDEMRHKCLKKAEEWR